MTATSSTPVGFFRPPPITGRRIGGSAGIKDNAGNALATDIVWSFATSTPSIIISNLSVPEGSSGTRSGSLVATLSAPSSSTVTVNYATANGTATSGSDYVAASDVLTFAPGMTSAAIPITVIGDTTSEADETVLVHLSGATNVTIADSQGVLTITNDDLPQLTINNSSVTEPSPGSATATFTVTVTPPNEQTVAVGYATANGTATSGTDYTATSGTLTFSPGATTRSINGTALGDLLDEANETFVVNLSNPVNARRQVAEDLLRQLNDFDVHLDGVPRCSFSKIVHLPGRRRGVFVRTGTPMSQNTR